MSDAKNESSVERIKKASDGLRGTIQESLQNEITGAISEDDQSLVKFHGMYQQDDRDRREERAMKKLERLYSFMIRLRLPGGFLTPEQWIALHEVATNNSTGVIKITTRQTIQLHGIIKSKVRPTIQFFNAVKLDLLHCYLRRHQPKCTLYLSPKSVSDSRRNLCLCGQDQRTFKTAKTQAYYEIWLDEEKMLDKKSEEDPLYQDRYMPRKFKIGNCHPTK